MSKKVDFPVSDARRYLEPGPVVLISSRWKGSDNIMTLGWHSILEFTPSLWGAMISSGNHSHRMIRESGECVVNLPTADMVDIVSLIGNCDGESTDKFEEFGLTKTASAEVGAPGIAQCHASFECKLYDDTLVDSRNFFIFEIVKADVAERPAHPETLHYIGGGSFVTAGKVVPQKSLFTKVT
jgi:flavin reductase (DIM6/NTAB) family NADH-FMN oxidoreductase RutF